MKIAVMSPWNAVCGNSVHIELVVGELIRRGHEVTVFAHDGSDYINGKIIKDDEQYVFRNFSIPLWRGYEYLDPGPILKTDFELFIVVHLSLMPRQELLKIFYSDIKKKAKTILMVHEFFIPLNPVFYKFKWDAVICLDRRYKRYLSCIFPVKKIHTIPYPCVPAAEGDMDTSRSNLGLPKDQKIILLFGFRLKNYLSVLPALLNAGIKCNALILVVTEDATAHEIFKMAKEVYDRVEIRNETPTTETLYEYLHAADATVLHKGTFLGFIKSFGFVLFRSCFARKDKKDYQKLLLLYAGLFVKIVKNKEILFDLILSLPNAMLSMAEPVVVSSAVYQCLGSGCPILISRGRYTATLNGEVLIYSNVAELEQGLISIFEKRKKFYLIRKLARECIEKNSPSKITDRFIELFHMIQ